MASSPSGWVGRSQEAGAQDAGGWRWLWLAPSGKVAVDLSTPAERGTLSRDEPGWAEHAAHGCLRTWSVGSARLRHSGPQEGGASKGCRESGLGLGLCKHLPPPLRSHTQAVAVPGQALEKGIVAPF